jgi:hypothetical protein
MPVETDNNANISDDVALLASDEGNSPVVEAEPSKPEVKETKPERKKAGPETDDVDELLSSLDSGEEESDSEPEEGDASQEILPFQRPTVKQIQAKFPDFFKTFPNLKDAFFREKQFSEVFHTPTEAKEAAESANAYKDLISDVVNGTGEKIIPALKESGSLEKYSKNFLGNLYKADKDLHWKTILPVLEDSVRAAFREGRRLSDDNLKNAALVLSNFLFADMDVAEGKKTFVEKDTVPDKKVSDERAAFERDRYNNFLIDTNESYFGSLNKEISKGFSETDGLTKFMRESIRKEVIAKAEKVMRSDKLHMRHIDRLWQEAKSNGYRSEDRARLTNAWLARAKSLIPTLRRQMIAEALGSSPTEIKKKNETIQRQQQRMEPGSSGRPNSQVQRPVSAKRVDFRRTSDMDILNDRITLKRT